MKTGPSLLHFVGLFVEVVQSERLSITWKVGGSILCPCGLDSVILGQGTEPQIAPSGSSISVMMYEWLLLLMCRWCLAW